MCTRADAEITNHLLKLTAAAAAAPPEERDVGWREDEANDTEHPPSIIICLLL